MKFWTAAARQKLDWVEKMRGKHGYVIAVVGGSTTTFGIDAEYIEREHGLPVANLGLHVGMGPEALVGFGLSSLHEGDTLVLSLEPSILTEDYPENSKLGTKLSLMLTKPEMLKWHEQSYVLPSVEAIAMVPPGGYHLMTMLGKLVMGKPLYRYSIENLQPGGLQVTEERRNFAAQMDVSNPGGTKSISDHGVELLRAAVSAAEERGIKLVYALPWSYWPAETADERRVSNELLTNEIAEIVPVLYERSRGVHSKLADFSDSGQHLSADASITRSASLAHSIDAQINTMSDKAQHTE
jgi:hypothetical protein